MSDRSDNTEKLDCKVSKLPRRKDFLRLRSGKRYSCANFSLQAKKNVDAADQSDCRVGYTVTTKVGNAVVRNRIKRRFRAAVGESFPSFAKSGHDYAVIARSSALDAEFATIVQDLKAALDHVHKNRAKGAGKQK